jgi:SMC interacting uncharacterized protein involved in chromosome segregation
LCSPKTEVSFTTKINKLQEREARLTCELNKWRNHNQKLEQHIQEWKLVAEQSQSNVFKYRDGVSKLFVLSAELKSELPFN